ncbi:MAG: glycyl-radical enzyme activating protein [Verrucomicrobia bacterium]|nr:glycyl-radical enzyme activating protein [Verrucomicrobiota bacterium]
MRSSQTGLVFNIQKYSVNDGPGIRTTVFLKGCPLRCTWCHNPEGISAAQELIWIKTRCTSCGACRSVCQIADLVPGQGPIPSGHEKCVLCFKCVSACPSGARQVAGREMTVEEVMDEVRRDQMFYEDSGGGVTFSGGEPFRQHKFLMGLLEAGRNKGLHTAVDTCGFVSKEKLIEALPLVDLFLYDIKMMDDAKHVRYTGVSNSLIIENLRLLDDAGAHIWLRIPIIPEVNDSPTDVEAIVKLAAQLKSVQQINLLPYHSIGAHKSRNLGKRQETFVFRETEPAKMREVALRFQVLGVPVRVGG